MRPASPRSSVEPPTGVFQGLHLDLSPLWHAAWGLGRQLGPCAYSSVTVLGTSAPVPEPLRAAVRPQPRVSPHGVVTSGRVIGGEVVTLSVGFSHGMRWGSQPLLSPQGYPFLSRLFQMFGKQGLKFRTLFSPDRLFLGVAISP